MLINNQEKVINYGEISVKFEIVASTAYEKVNTTGTDENLFRLVPMPRLGARVLSPELAPEQGHGTQISARAPTKGYVHTGARNRASGTCTKSELFRRRTYNNYIIS